MACRKGATPVDLNYLFHRQQVERTRAEAALSEAARRIHAELAQEYERKIEQLSEGSVSFDHPTAAQVKSSRPS
jgi:phage gp36-like protein